MSFRQPPDFDALRLIATGGESLEAEILAEKATTLGRAGRRLEAALEAHKAAEGKDRRLLAYRAAEAAQAFFIQRELMGMRRHDEAISKYAIPHDVLAKIGAKP